MGLRFRKSVKIGPVRLTASKSGVSYSVGVKGARVTKRADGRIQTTAGIPNTGIYYTETHKISNKKSEEASTPTYEKPKKKRTGLKILIGFFIVIIFISIISVL